MLLIGYLSGFAFAKQYKYQQILNAINALNASLVLFDSQSAIGNRIFCLFVGIAIVLLINLAVFLWKKRHPSAPKSDGQPQNEKEHLADSSSAAAIASEPGGLDPDIF